MISSRISHLILPLAVLAVAVPAQAQDAVLSDQVLPQDTFLHMTIKSVDDAKQQFADSSYGQLIDDPALQDFRAELENALSGPVGEVVAEVEAELGMSVDDILSIPSGEVSVSIAAVGTSIGLVVHVDVGESSDKAAALLQLAEDALNQAPQLAQSTIDIDGTEVTMYEVQEKVPTPLLKEFGWFIRDGHVVACSSQAVMESLIENWGGAAAESLSANEKYTSILSRLESEPGSADSVFYLDLIGLLGKLSQSGSFGEAQFMASMAIAQLPMLGLDQLQAIGAVSEATSGDVQMVNRAMVYADTPPKGLMRMFKLEPVNASPPSWVKEDAVMYMTTHWQISEAYQAVEELVDGFQGPGTLAALIDQVSESGPGVHIKSDLIDQLTGEVHMVGGGLDKTTGTNEMLFAIGIQDVDAFSDMLARISDEPGFPLTMREFRGFTLYEMSEAGPTVGLTVANGSFLVAIGETILEQVLRNDDDIRPLAESDDFQKIAERFPSEVVAVNFARPAEQYRSLYEMLQSGEAADQFPGMDELFSQIDFTTLPPFEAISKYLAPAGGFTVADEDGYVSEGFTLSP